MSAAQEDTRDQEIINLEVDDRNDADSAIASDASSAASTSIASSIIDYVQENGRRYHKYREGSYYLPNDEPEQARLDLLHYISRAALKDKLYIEPFPTNITRCLDVGTGTGIWAMDLADEFDKAEVIGVDLSPIQPTWVPPNLKFYVDDVNTDWGYKAEEAFDLIHIGGMGGSAKSWPNLLQQAYDNLVPGGMLKMNEYESWVFSDSDPTLSSCPNVKKWTDVCNEAAMKMGSDLNMGPQLEELMKKAGFVNIRVQVAPIPVGSWAKGSNNKRMGQWQLQQVSDSVDSFTPRLLTAVLGWKFEECEVLMTQAKKELRKPSNHLYTRFWYLSGERPDQKHSV